MALTPPVSSSVPSDRFAPYRGRFAPSPTGPLHAGSLVAALASWLDARAHSGRWLVRIEDLDPPREVPGASTSILSTLAAFGLVGDEPVTFQSQRNDAFAAGFEQLLAQDAVFGCACTRRELDDSSGNGAIGIYPGICRHGTGARAPRAWRVRVPDITVDFDDRAAGHVCQALAAEVGDFVLKRADGLWAYQLAVVVDDAAQGITDVVRGADLLDNTPRQIFLQRLLGYPTPRYLHVPIVTNAAGEKLSKQTGATALDAGDVRAELERAWQHLGFAPLGADSRDAFLRRAVDLWRERWVDGLKAPV
ncbi:MAG TPA: tRNA glutamyl-Q(34) synthetase GluQRS [Burkholderiaceae bacterium]|nr:tRNA glutamyl-Q(34) synthetase GluQRS [Burkholderiaceae bacterium]